MTCNGFSMKWENLQAAYSPWYADYNFDRNHSSAEPVQRSAPLPDGLALDTKTGRECRAIHALPRCYDLYNGKD